LFSEQFDNAWWLKTASITANSTISPSGIQNADTFTDSSAVSYLDVRTSAITITANATYTASFFIKKTTGALTNYAGVGFILTGTVQRTDFGIINTTTGQVVRDAASSINVATYSSQSYNDYWRVIVTFTDNQSNTNCSMYLYPAISTNGTSISPTAQGSNVFWGAQFELGAYPTSYIPTTAATVTRNTDTFQLSNVFTNNMISSAGGTWFVDLRNNLPILRSSANATMILDTSSSTPTNGFAVIGGLSSQRAIITKNISGTATTMFLTTTNSIKVAIKWNGTTADIFVNGVKVVAATAFTTTAMENIVANGSAVPIFNNSMALYNTPLSDDECIAKTL
jgi:cytochrome c-type biogenesis protein CcmE